jgi:endonuclease YncB( thermonuclease family)
MINWQMVREGWAVTITVSPNVQYVDYFQAARDAAQREGRDCGRLRVPL